MWYIHSVEYYSAMKKMGEQRDATTWVNPRHSMKEASQGRPRGTRFYSSDMFQVGESVETKSGLGIVRGWGVYGIFLLG